MSNQLSQSSEYGWCDLNTDNGRTVTGNSPMNNIEDITFNMIKALGWSDTHLVAEMFEEIKTKVRDLNTMYHKKLNRKREDRQREIIEMLRWNQLVTATYTSSTSPKGPNMCFLNDGTPVEIIRVAVMCGGPNPETLEFHNVQTHYGGNENPTEWVPAQEGNDGWRIGSARGHESAGEEKTNQVSSDDWEDNLRRALRGCNKESEIEDILRIRRLARTQKQTETSD